MSFGDGDLHCRVDQLEEVNESLRRSEIRKMARIEALERERDYWRGECKAMLNELCDVDGERGAMLDYPRPSSEPSPVAMAMATRIGHDQYRDKAERRMAELEAALNDVTGKWAVAMVDAEENAKRCRLLESLLIDVWPYVWELRVPGRRDEEFMERMEALGLMEGDAE